MSTILIIYPYFSPARRAGGIVSSLTNLVDLLENKSIYVITSCYDLDGSRLNVLENSWIAFSKNCSVFYSSKEHKLDFNATISQFKINTVYINGVFGFKFVVSPLWQLRNWKKLTGNRIVIAPRGMIQKGSLSIKPIKKFLYFFTLKNLDLFDDIKWHATDNQEFIDITNFFKTTQITLAKDSPSLQPQFLSKLPKIENKIRLVFLSLLTEKKNIKFLLNVLKMGDFPNLTLDIYGPIKDELYWKECLSQIQMLPNVKYCGEIQPNDVTAVLNKYDYFVLPTLGENFGHVIFESLVAGTPVIISDKTPWQDINLKKVGWCLQLDETLWYHFFLDLYKLDANQYRIMSDNCHTYILNYLAENNPIKEYEMLMD